MKRKKKKKNIHPKGELSLKPLTGVAIDTFGGKIHVEWADDNRYTTMGQLSFFIQFLKTAELLDPWIEDCPISYSSPNAPTARDILGTILLSVLNGHKRYHHITAISSDNVNPGLLGMKKVMSEDSVRRAFEKIDEEKCNTWQLKHLRRCYDMLLSTPWILDIDSTVKCIYGKQEGAEIGYNPKKQGRPSHVYHTYMLSGNRLILDTEVQPGNQTASSFSYPSLFKYLDSLPKSSLPQFIRGDCGFGTENIMNEAEKRGIPYLFRLRKSKNIKKEIERSVSESEWKNVGDNWEGYETTMRLMGWTRSRRVLILRREIKGDIALLQKQLEDSLGLGFVETSDYMKKYEYSILVTSLSYELLSLSKLYRERADIENAFDELKNQWGWLGYTTQDLLRSRIMSRNIALIYNWWSLYSRMIIPGKHTEAITSRPLLLHSVGVQSTHGRQTKLEIKSSHGKSGKVKRVIALIAHFLKHLEKNAEQLTWAEKWKLILQQIFQEIPLFDPPKLLEFDLNCRI